MVLIIGVPHLTAFVVGHANARKALEEWTRKVRSANWQTPSEIRVEFSSASFLPGNRVVFNIKGNAFRLVARFHLPEHAIKVLWIGTHAEYDRRNWRTDTGGDA